MNKQIKLLLALGFGVLAFDAQAQSCDPCNQPNKPATCNPPPPPPPGDSMPVGVDIDDMPTAIFADEAALSADTTLVASSAAK